MPKFNTGGAEIHYEERGAGPLAYVYCHGLGGSGERFERDDMDWYARHFRTISWDNRGLGRSGQANRYSLPDYASDLAKLLDELNVDQAIIFGVSWGGVVAQRFGLDYPDKCAALVLDSTSSEVNVAASENWYARGEIARVGMEAALGGKSIAPAFEGHSTASENSQRPVPDVQVPSYVAQCRATAGMREHPLTGEIGRLAMPVLVIGAGKDTVAGAGGSVILSRNIRNSKLQIFQEAGHGAYASARADFRECLLDFLDENSIYKQG
ncbi:MAG: hypothetical protein CL771_03125 [Chloroflexi bacterium]|nr:hypothetical protein [Chloroflexota bacterium]|tara:strand:- start:189 stop:989 length:801 start_codon:yes stop_codon:yes gene_type:complete